MHHCPMADRRPRSSGTTSDWPPAMPASFPSGRTREREYKRCSRHERRSLEVIGDAQSWRWSGSHLQRGWDPLADLASSLVLLRGGLAPTVKLVVSSASQKNR